MIGELSTALRWCAALARKFMGVAPVETLVVVVATLVAQVAILLAFFMPLKVIILLGSSGTPRYFPPVLAEMERDALILLLSGAAVGCYFLYLLSESLIARISDRGAERLLASSQKMILFDNQSDVAATAYKRYAQALAGSVFVILALIILGVFYPALAFLAVGYSIAVFLLFLLLYRFNNGFQDFLAGNYVALMGAASAVGFLLAFSYLVADFLLWSPPGLILAIISLLLVRQAFIRTSGLIADLTELYRQKQKLDALFFYKHTLKIAGGRRDTGYWALLRNDTRNEWLADVLSEVTGSDVEVAHSRWTQTGIANVAAFVVDHRYYVKLFNSSRRAMAIHEATFLTETASLPMPVLPLLGIESIEGFNCHIFDNIRPTDRPSPKQIQSRIRELRERLWSIEPPASLADRYGRSRPMLTQRLSIDMADRLRNVIGGGEENVLLGNFHDSFEHIMNILSALPLCIHNPDIRSDTIVQSENGDQAIVHWGRWSIEPIGAGWGAKEGEQELLSGTLASAAQKRRALASISTDHVYLSSLMFAFDGFYHAQNYQAAIELIPGIMARIQDRMDGAVRAAQI